MSLLIAARVDVDHTTPSGGDMSYKPRFQKESTKVIGVRGIKNNYLRRLIMVVAFLPIVIICAVWNLAKAVFWFAGSIPMTILTLGESVYIHWHYQGDDK